MNSKKLILSALTVSMLSGCIVIAKPSRANVEFEKELSITASHIQHLDISAGAGELHLIGSDTAKDISIKAHVFTTSSKRDDYDLSLDSNGEKAYIVAKHNSTSGMWIGNSPRIDITVTAPSSMSITIDDGSGDMWISHFNNDVRVKDGSGEIEIKNTQGNLDIDDGSGSITLSNITGNLEVEDGSGELTITQVQGNVDVEDGSGQIVVSDIQGNLTIEDASGDMIVRDISGQVVIDDGSGDIDVTKAGGLRIVEEGSGDLRVKEVKGSFEIGH